MAVIREIEAYAGKPLKVIGHNQIAAKACPGFQVPVWLPAALRRYPVRASKPEIAAHKSIWTIIAGILKRIFGGGNGTETR